MVHWLSIFAAAATDPSSVVDLPPTEVVIDVPPEPDLTTGTATVVDVAPEQASGASLAETLERVPGVTLRRSGGPGSFVALSLRGMGAQNVTLVLDDMPLASATLGPFDLSLYPPELVEHLEVYRGASPVRFGSALGGVVRLVSRAPGGTTTASAHVGYGAFLTRSAHAAVSGPAGDVGYDLGVAYQGSRGDFRYHDDRNTLYNAGDDLSRRRANNAFDTIAFHGSARTQGPRSGSWRLGAHGSWREQGLPGAGIDEARTAHARDRELGVRASLDDTRWSDDRGTLTAGADVFAASRAFADPHDEIGLDIAALDSSLVQVGVDARLQWLWTLRHETEVAPRVAWSAYAQESDTASAAIYGRSLARRRGELALGIEHRWDIHDDLRLVLSTRGEAQADEGTAVAGHARVVQASPRAGALLTLGPCELRASGGRHHRFATLVERYGDGVVTVASPDLAPEHGVSADAGARCGGRPFARMRKLEVETTAFATRADDLITLVQTSQAAAQARNLGRASLRGVEAALFADAVLASLDLAYTLTRARDASGGLLAGNAVPGVPVHHIVGAVEAGPEWARLRWQSTFVSQLYLDVANLRPVPARLTHDVALTSALGETGFSAKLTVKNLTDRRVETVTLAGAPGGEGRAAVADFLGYPLPGRAWFLALSWTSS